MNKNTEVLVAEYHEDAKYFTRIYSNKNIHYAPLIVKKAYDKNPSDGVNQVLSDWFRGRGIPEGRDKLDMLMARLNIDSPVVLLDKAFGLSLSDQYWIKPFHSDLNYDDINFFENDFNDLEFTEATFTTKGMFSSEYTLKTPNNTTDGVLRKTWVMKGNKRYLLKAGLRSEVLQPFNEVLASQICERLGFKHISYTIDTIKNNIVSKCECFINPNTEFIPAYQILSGIDKDHAYDSYISVLSENGIENAKEKTDNMFILDYLMLNNDRHLNNFGIIRNVNTLKWIDVAPIFDTGNSLNLLDYTDDELLIEGEGRFFYTIDSFDHIIKAVDDLKRIDLSRLEDLPQQFDHLLTKYQHITNMSSRRINRLCVLLNSRINKLKECREVHQQKK